MKSLLIARWSIVCSLVILIPLFAIGGTSQLTVVNPDGSGTVVRKFVLTDSQVQAGALESCLSLRPDSVFAATTEVSGTTTVCVHTASFANAAQLRQVYAVLTGVTINQVEMQDGKFLHNINVAPPTSPPNLATDLWQVQMPGSILAHNASGVTERTLSWETQNGCNNNHLYATSLDGRPFSNAFYLPIVSGLSPRPFAIESTRDLGTVGHPPSVTARDVGASTLVGRCILWLFGDTLFHPKSVDGTNLRSSTAGLANPANPFNPIEALDANGAPYDFLPFTSEEQAYNQNPNYPSERYALWVESAVATPDGNALVFYLKLKVHPGTWNYELLGTGIATTPAGSTTATREPTLLFNSPEPLFQSALVYGAYVYVYGCKQSGPLSLPCYVARVPLMHARTRSAYEFWNGSVWVSDIAQVSQVFEGAWSGLTVSWNPYLSKFVLVHSKIFSNDVVIQTAPKPEGPWSSPSVAFTGMPSADGTNDYTAREHPELASDGGRKMILSYYQPLDAFSGNLRLVELVLR